MDTYEACQQHSLRSRSKVKGQGHSKVYNMKFASLAKSQKLYPLHYVHFCDLCTVAQHICVQRYYVLHQRSRSPEKKLKIFLHFVSG